MAMEAYRGLTGIVSIQNFTLPTGKNESYSKFWCFSPGIIAVVIGLVGVMGRLYL